MKSRCSIQKSAGRLGYHRVGILLCFLALPLPATATAADADVAELLFRSGDYDAAIAMADEQVRRGVWNERWSRLLIRGQLATGQYAEAVRSYRSAIERYPSSLILRRLGIDALRYGSDADAVRQAKAQFIDTIRRSSRFASRENVIAAGRFFADAGEDAREILKQFYDRVREADPKFSETYVATAELALQKGDFKVAADTVAQGIAVDASDPRLFYLQARAFEPSDRKVATDALNMALSLNPRHVDSWLLRAENAIDAEQYEEAKTAIGHVLDVNHHEPRAWALLAVLAHLRGDYVVEKLMRDAAMTTWADNPDVDHLIGKKLSDKYRFAEGAEYQRESLRYRPDYPPAQFQLAQDLLRLGFDDVGWDLAEEVNRQDPYNVVAFNLVSLHDRIKNFANLHGNGIHVRMDPREAEIYGDQVLELLGEAREVLCAKYDVQPNAPVIVEIFDKQSDFAIRTFGLPGGAGFLGVCFGRVITANSPASQGAFPSNWKAVLWHEFCHVVTLTKTNNRMPRWLSEGISVYEERTRDPSWSEKITPAYKLMMLEGDLVPISQLSAAFLKPKSPLHLQFAYYQSSIAVEYIIETFGIEALKEVLNDLADGVAVNDALASRLEPLSRLDQGFLGYARSKAEAFGDGVEWVVPGPEAASDEADRSIEAWSRQHPDDYRTLSAMGAGLMRAEQYADAAEVFERMREGGVVSGERGGVLDSLATIYRELGESEKELEVLRQRCDVTSDALSAHIRLAELAQESQDWSKVQQHSQQILAIQPLLPDGHQFGVLAAEQTDRPADAIAPLQALLKMEPFDAAELHYRLAVAWESLGQRDRAKRSVLRALEHAPRYRDALALLLRVKESE